MRRSRRTGISRDAEDFFVQFQDVSATEAAGKLIYESTVGNSRICFEILLACFVDNFIGERWRRRRLVPIKRLEIVAHELFVEARRADAGAILVSGPETRRVGCED